MGRILAQQLLMKRLDPKKVISIFGIIAMVMMLAVLFAIAVEAKLVPNLKEVTASYPEFYIILMSTKTGILCQVPNQRKEKYAK